MCACVCVCVCTRVCALGILPPLPPPTDGSVRPSAWSARPRPKAARPQAHAELGDSPNPQYYFPQQVGRLRRGCVSAPPAHAPQRPPRRKFSFGVSPSPIPVGVAAARKAGSPAGQPSMGRLDPSIPPPCSQKFSSGERTPPPGRGPSGQRGPLSGAEGKGRSPRHGSYRRLGVPRAGPGPRRLSARLGAPGARAAGHAVGAGGAGRVRRCGSGPPPPPLLLPPVSARGGLSRRSRSSPHATD